MSVCVKDLLMVEDMIRSDQAAEELIRWWSRGLEKSSTRV